MKASLAFSPFISRSLGQQFVPIKAKNIGQWPQICYVCPEHPVAMSVMLISFSVNMEPVVVPAIRFFT